MVAIVVVLLYRWNRTCFFLACFAFLNFVPASNLFFPIGTIMADRLLYLPSLGLLACLVLAIYAFARAPNLKPGSRAGSVVPDNRRIRESGPGFEIKTGKPISRSPSQTSASAPTASNSIACWPHRFSNRTLRIRISTK